MSKAKATDEQKLISEPGVVREVLVELTGRTGIIMHADNIEWADQMEEWRKDASNKKRSKAGDDRTPPYTWHGCLYYDDFLKGEVTIPSENIMRCIMDGAAQIPTGKGRGSFKSQSQSGMISRDFHWKFRNNGEAIMMSAIQQMRGLPFKDQIEAAHDLGFLLYVKRVNINNKKHVRVRPRFDHWTLSGALLIADEQITDKILKDMWDICGRLVGLGDWRPSAPKRPGPFGTFRAQLVS